MSHATSLGPCLRALSLLAAVALSGCASLTTAPQTTASRAPDGYAQLPQARPEVVSYALSLQGTPYRYGGSSPREGFDCSGFVYHVYSQDGLRLPRTSSEMARTLLAISAEQLRPGDLVFFNTSGRPFSHVGVYIGNNQFVHAPSRRGQHVKISNLNETYWKARLEGFRRPESPRQIAAR